MRKNCLIFGLLFSFLTIGYSQTHVVDSLKQRYYQADSDSLLWYYSLQVAAKSYRSNADSALTWAKKSVAHSEDSGSQLMKSGALNTIGVIYYYKGDLETALENYFQVVKAAGENPQNRYASTALGNIGMLYAEQNDQTRALRYLKQALEAKESLNDSIGIARNLNNIGLVFTNREMHDSAIIYYEKQVEICEELGEEYGKSIGLNNLGESNRSKGNLGLAEKYFQQALNLKKKLGDKGGQSMVMGSLADIYIKRNQPQRAISFLEESLGLAKETKSLLDLNQSYEQLTESFAQIGDFKNAFKYQNLFLETKDSIRNRETISRIAELETKYQTEEQEKQLVQQQLTITKQKSNQRLLIFGSIASIFLLLGGFQYFRSRQRVKQRETELALQLEKSEADQLRELGQLKSNFFANISHEFRTPLTLMLGPLQEMKNGTFTGNAQKYFGIMFQQGERLLSLVNQILDLSRLESGQMKLHLEHGDVVAFLRTIEFSFESLADRRHIDFQTDFPNGKTTMPFDRDKLSKIVTNLLSNAFKFTPEGGTVAMKTRVVKTHLEIKISDTGIGIPKEELHHVLNRFFQAKNSSSGVQAGTGIGLALVQELTALHKGKIQVESKEEIGTTFIVRLPMINEAYKGIEIFDHNAQSEIASAILKTSDTVVLSTESKRANKHTILVVEDNPDVRTYVSDTLLGSYKVIEAENGEAGLNTAFEKMPDLIISDVMMPKMDGNQLCEKLKTDPRTSHIPVVLLTAKTGHESKIEGLETGADDYLTKPFDAIELKVRVKNLIEQRKRLRESFRGSAVLKPKDIAVTSADEQFLIRAIEAIEKNMDNEDFSIEEMGRAIGMSRSQLHRKIKALTDKSPSVFLRTMRLQRAKQLLEKGAGNATEVAYQTGFSNAAYFSKTFKDLFGVSPSEVKASKK